jgi:hypothetical protein
MATHGVIGDFVLVAEDAGVVRIEPGRPSSGDRGDRHPLLSPASTHRDVDAPNAIVRASAVIAAFGNGPTPTSWPTPTRRARRIVPRPRSTRSVRLSVQPHQRAPDRRVLRGHRICRGEPAGRRSSCGALGQASRDSGTDPLSTPKRAARPPSAIRLSRPDVRHAAPDRTIGDLDVARHRAFNELGIPASRMPRSASRAVRKSFKVADLVDASRVYARIAMDLCNRDREPAAPRRPPQP